MKTHDSAPDKNVVRKTSDEIKKGLECCGKGTACKGHCPYCGTKFDINSCTGKLSRDALALINRLEGDNIAKAIVLEQLEAKVKVKAFEQIKWERDIAIDQLKQLGVGFGEKINGKLPKWISVEERLPEEETSVLICGWGYVDIGWIIDGGWRSEYINDYSADEITHWMPLPEPPDE